MRGDPGPIRARGASPSNDCDIESRLIFRRRVGSHVVLREAFHLEPRGSNGRTDPIAGFAFLVLLKDAVHMDGAASPEGLERSSEVVHRGVRKIQDDSVHRGDLPEDGVRVPVTYRDMVRPIRCDVLSKKSYRPWIRIRSVDLSRSASFRDEDRIRPDAREGVRDRFAGFDQIRDPLALRRESGTEVGSRQVYAIVQAVLRVNGGGPRLSGDDVDLPNPVLPFTPRSSRTTPIFGFHLRMASPMAIRCSRNSSGILMTAMSPTTSKELGNSRRAEGGTSMTSLYLRTATNPSSNSPSFVGKPRSTRSRVGRRIAPPSWAMRACFSRTPRSRRVRRMSSARARGTTTIQARMGAAISAGAKGFSRPVGPGEGSKHLLRLPPPPWVNWCSSVWASTTRKASLCAAWRKHAQPRSFSWSSTHQAWRAPRSVPSSVSSGRKFEGFRGPRWRTVG